jgi:hypothetical protein
MSGDDSLGTVRLTQMQMVRLAVDCLPPCFFLAMLVLYVAVLSDFHGDLKPSLVLFLAGITVFTGYESLKSARDLTLGVALVREDVLQRIGRTRPTRGRRYAIFAQLGKLWIRGSGVAESRATNRCRVVYSPASRSVWSFEPLDVTGALR